MGLKIPVENMFTHMFRAFPTVLTVTQIEWYYDGVTDVLNDTLQILHITSTTNFIHREVDNETLEKERL